MNYKAAIIDLRKKIPIGISAAKKLLEQTSLDVQEAESIWKANQINALAEKIADS